jgi:pimeloyl-ACP methyl ester carboxylesterase
MMQKPLYLLTITFLFLLGLISSISAAPAHQDTPPQTPVHIDVDGHSMYLDCQGTGGPTVIFESGLGVSSFTWFEIQRQAREFRRVCRYDRAGLGQSPEPGPMPRTSAQIVEELHTLLTEAEIEGPYILVGASFGGMTSLLYASEYPDDIVGIVLVDSTHPDLDVRIEELLTPEQAQERRDELAMNAEGIRFEDILTSDDQVREAEVPDVPMVVLRHGVPFRFSEGWPAEEIEALWVELTNDLASLVSNSVVIVAEESGHRIAESEPELVIEAIELVVVMAEESAIEVTSEATGEATDAP